MGPPHDGSEQTPATAASGCRSGPERRGGTGSVSGRPILTVAVLDAATGEREDLRLRQDGEEVEWFYAGLRPPVTVAIESTGCALWFHALMRRLGHTLLVGAAKIRASVVRKTKTDRRDARHILTLLSEKRLPTVWVPDPGDEQASYAQFTDLESALVTAGILFDRLSDPVAEYEECVRSFRPGMTEPYDAASDGYEPMLPVREVRRRFADGLDNLRAWLDHQHPAISQLERLEIVEDEAGDAA